MERVKKICPVCGAANPLDEERCGVCGASLETRVSIPLGERLPVPWREVGISLALGAAALALRAGLHLVRGLLERKAAGQMELHERPASLSKVRKWPPWRRRLVGSPSGPKAAWGALEEAPRPRPQLRMWGRRAWGVWSSDGASYWEVEEVFWEGSRQ